MFRWVGLSRVRRGRHVRRLGAHLVVLGRGFRCHVGSYFESALARVALARVGRWYRGGSECRVARVRWWRCEGGCCVSCVFAGRLQPCHPWRTAVDFCGCEFAYSLTLVCGESEYDAWTRESQHIEEQFIVAKDSSLTDVRFSALIVARQGFGLGLWGEP